jgi:hypothetical protein
MRSTAWMGWDGSVSGDVFLLNIGLLYRRNKKGRRKGLPRKILPIGY